MKKIIIFIFISFLLACEAPVGDVGPAGPAGAEGAKGDKGDTGGKGTFSAIVSDWKEIKPANWLKGGSDLSFIAAFDEPKLTADITNKGLVLGFYRTLPEDASSQIFPIPDETSNYSLGVYASFTSSLKAIGFFLDFRNSTVSEIIFKFSSNVVLKTSVTCKSHDLPKIVTTGVSASSRV